MSTFEPPPDYIRDTFRDYLIDRGGTGGFGLGHAEEVRRFKFYLDTFEDFISRQESEEIASLEAEVVHLTEEGRSEFWSWYYPVHWEEIFRTNLRSSFLVSLISLIESRLTEVSRDVAVIARTPIQIGDLKGSLLERANLFLERFGAFKQPTAEAWARVSQINDIRNVFFHHAGYLPAYNHEKRARQFIQSSDMLSETNGSLTLNPEFCAYSLQIAQTFLDAIASELSALCSRIQRFEAPSR
ncbi:MAG: hypothetical protein ACREV2_08455 [Burkholderiales bacterium]